MSADSSWEIAFMRSKAHLAQQWGFDESSALGILEEVWQTHHPKFAERLSKNDLAAWFGLVRAEAVREWFRQNGKIMARHVKRLGASGQTLGAAIAAAAEAARHESFAVPPDILAWAQERLRAQVIHQVFEEHPELFEVPASVLTEVFLRFAKSDKILDQFLKHENRIAFVRTVARYCRQEQQRESRPLAARLANIDPDTPRHFAAALRRSRRNEAANKSQPAQLARKRGFKKLLKETIGYCELFDDHAEATLNEIASKGLIAADIAKRRRRKPSEVDETLNLAIEYLERIWLPQSPQNLNPEEQKGPFEVEEAIQRRVTHCLRQAEARLGDHRGVREGRRLLPRHRAVYLLARYFAVPNEPAAKPGAKRRRTARPWSKLTQTIIATAIDSNQVRVQQWLSQAEQQIDEDMKLWAARDPLLAEHFVLLPQLELTEEQSRSAAWLALLLDGVIYLTVPVGQPLSTETSSHSDAQQHVRSALWYWWCCGSFPSRDSAPAALLNGTGLNEFRAAAEVAAREHQQLIDAVLQRDTGETADMNKGDAFSEARRDWVQFYRELLPPAWKDRAVFQALHHEHLQWSNHSTVAN